MQHFGAAGVDIFFVLSGFLVGGLLVKEWRVKGRIDGKSFLVRRSLKIWPQYYVFLLLVIASGHRSVHALWGNLLNIQNYAGGIAHTWSLAVEEHAYLLILLILAVAARWKARMRSVFLFLGVLSIGIELLRLYLASRFIPVFYPTHTRVDAIFYGVMLAILYHYAPETFHRVQRWTWLWVGMLAAFSAVRALPSRGLVGPGDQYRHGRFHGHCAAYAGVQAPGRPQAQLAVSGGGVDWALLLRHLPVARLGGSARGCGGGASAGMAGAGVALGGAGGAGHPGRRR
jgi:peptidoglycan/LPS O-acetylase OafA/YrhL